ncbi:hypothetical protein Q5424_09370 [Conexibacter sp. JD483]|uniref:hypothetical protein n=1 Tax=unclassified Conexibacter TaxID=2627773 RepID=UPI00271CECF1|nr:MULTISPECIES: hypothetical protein [unclassified Conexibacter]MDO8187214.1 hypothetical protein [Conexibacter sp. CPCC 205706]MDO8199311.1 hypothetical protein [Conexibacter sp. CPCC 205762]MDR9369288.1 hypothetical protein [Conexibacter sp. JD483]
MSAIAWKRDARTLDGDIWLDGRGVDVAIGDGIVSFDEELSLVGSSVVRIAVFDPDRVLVESDLFKRDKDDEDRLENNVELELDGISYWLRSVAKVGDQFRLTFEDRTVSRLRARGKASLANPTWTDHVAFVQRLCRLADVSAPVLEAPSEQERRASDTLKGTSRGKRASALADADDRRAAGIDDDERLRIKSHWARPAQLDVATRLLATAKQLGASPKAMRALIAAAIESSELRNETRADDRGGIGVLRAVPAVTRSHAGRFTRSRANDVEFSAEAFLRDSGFTGKGGALRAERENGTWSIGRIVKEARGGVRPETFDRWNDQARAIVDAFKADDAAGEDESDRKDQSLFVYRGETYWDACVRIGELNDYVFFVAANKVYYLPERTLRTSRPRLRIGEQTPGIHTIDWEWAPHKRLKRVEVTCDVLRGTVPGAVVVLDDDCGPARGRWIVGEYRRSRYSQTTVVTLVRTRRRKRGGDR